MLGLMFNADASMDALFTVAVRTTGIFCRPSCRPPRKPKPQNVEFYKNAAEALAAGFRACKLCRPDGVAPLERERQVVNALVNNALEFPSVAAMARAAGMSVSRLHRVFKAHRGVTPAEILNRVRIEAACKRLDDTTASVAEIALEVGFQSLSAFNANFRRYMQTSPMAYRQSHSRLQPNHLRRAA